MINTIADYTMQLWRQSTKTRRSPKGWISGNAVCCVHNGETADKRGRGGVTVGTDHSVSYHCFNCGFKAYYRPGWHLPFKLKKLLKWMGASDTEIQRLTIEAIRVRDIVGVPEQEHEEIKDIKFKPKSLPENLINVTECDDDDPALIYCKERRLDLDEYVFFKTNEKLHNLSKRLIIPCFWKGGVIGYTGRTWDDKVQPKYFNQYDSDYVFNVEKQNPESRFVIVVEGPIDAISIDGVATVGNEISEQQANIIDSLVREVIVVPDADSSGNKLIDAALEYGWSVSFPIWQETCKDINKAVCEYGKLFVLKSIIDAKESNKLKIELMKKKLNAQ